MTTERPAEHLGSLVRELCALPRETEWVEFKENDAEPSRIGEYYVTRQPMTNGSLRQRLGIDDRNIATASRLLGEAVESGLIVIADSEVGTRIRSYLPFWAAPRPDRGPVA